MESRIKVLRKFYRVTSSNYQVNHECDIITLCSRCQEKNFFNNYNLPDQLLSNADISRFGVWKTNYQYSINDQGALLFTSAVPFTQSTIFRFARIDFSQNNVHYSFLFKKVLSSTILNSKPSSI